MRFLKKLSVVQAGLMFVAGVFLYWGALRLLKSPPLTSERLGEIALAMGCWLILLCGWCALVARIAKMRGWAPYMCGLVASLPFDAAAFISVVLSPDLNLPSWTNLFIWGGFGAVILTRQLAYTQSELSKTNDLTTLDLHS